MAGGGGSLKVERTKRGKAAKRKKIKRVGFHLDMTPLVDITFLLLTFFMFTTTMAAPQIMEMSIPPEKAQVDVKESLLRTILVDDSSRLFWYPANDPAEPIALKDIRQLSVRENLRNKEDWNQIIFSLKVSENAPYSLIVNILDELNVAEIAITEEITKELDEEGKPKKRERRFSLATLSELDYKKLEEIQQ